uniref:Uncharacterized protein n=1 Tax=Lepeophtheirus salmonis TaxID=72036 RepID=A0A0K2UKQ2_LEPSM
MCLFLRNHFCCFQFNKGSIDLANTPANILFDLFIIVNDLQWSILFLSPFLGIKDILACVRTAGSFPFVSI